MECLRCGYCCCFYDVIIISPDAIDASGNVDFNNDRSYQHKPTGEQCPHLSWENDIASCGIHEHSWFRKTPCHAFTQIGDHGAPCRMGFYIRGRCIDIRERLKAFQRVSYENFTQNEDQLEAEG